MIGFAAHRKREKSGAEVRRGGQGGREGGLKRGGEWERGKEGDEAMGVW